MKYTTETGPRPLTDGDRLRVAMALDRVAPRTGVIRGEADQYGLLRFEESYEHPWDETTRMKPGIDPFGLRIQSSFWIPSLAGGERRKVALLTERSSMPEPTLVIGQGDSAKVINPLAMTDDPETQVWFVNVYNTGFRRVDDGGIVRESRRGDLPELTPWQARMMFRVVDAKVQSDPDINFYPRRQPDIPRNSGFQTLDKRLVRVDPSLSGTNVFLITPYVPGRGNRNTTRFKDAVVLSVSGQEPIRREVVTEAIPLSAWINKEFAFRDSLRRRVSALAR